MNFRVDFCRNNLVCMHVGKCHWPGQEEKENIFLVSEKFKLFSFLRLSPEQTQLIRILMKKET